MDARVLPRVKAKVKHHNAMRWQDTRCVGLARRVSFSIRR